MNGTELPINEPRDMLLLEVNATTSSLAQENKTADLLIPVLGNGFPQKSLLDNETSIPVIEEEFNSSEASLNDTSMNITDAAASMSPGAAQILLELSQNSLTEQLSSNSSSTVPESELPPDSSG